MKPDPIIVEAIDAALVRAVSREAARAERAEAALAEAQRREELMRPVVEAVGQMVAERNARHGTPDNPAWWSGWDFKIVAAWDTYETQTGGTE